MARLKSPASCLALLLCAAQLVHSAQAAMVLSQEDSYMLKLLKPAARSALPLWMDTHDRLVEEMQNIRKSQEGLDYILYGDSIMEAFRGEMVGMPDERFADNKVAWQDKAPLRTAVLGISGDQAVHLLWRLRNGEGPKGLSPSHMTVMIGTNDVAHLSSVFGYNASIIGHVIGLGVEQCVRELQQQVPTASITVLGLLPLQPTMLGEAQHMYRPLVEAANRELRDYVEQQDSPRLFYKDCGSAFLLKDGTVDYGLMPDGVHPSGPGAEVLLKCLLEALKT